MTDSANARGQEDLAAELVVLAADYEASRDDHRQGVLRDAALASAGIAVFAAYFFLVVEHREFLRSTPLVAIVLPMGPFLIVASYTIFQIEAVLLGYYIRSVERAIQTRVTIASGLDADVFLPAYGHLRFAAVSSRYSSLRVKFLIAINSLAVAGVYGASVVVALSIIPTVVDQVAIGAFYALLGVGLLWTYYTTVTTPRPFYLRVFRRVPRVHAEGLDSPVAKSSSSRSPSGVRYLLLPRTNEVMKWAIFVLVWAGATVAFSFQRGYTASEIGRSVVLAALFLLVVEYLTYQARYQWNDLRGAEEDRVHVAVDLRGRLPLGWERRSLLTIVARLLLAGYIIHLVFRGTDFLASAYLVAIAPFVIAAPYEMLRGYSDKVGDSWGRINRLKHYAIYAYVGVGYGFRAVAGALIGAQFEFAPGPLALLALAAILAASAICVTYWAFEAAAERSAGQIGRPHVDALYRFLEPQVVEATSGLSEADQKSAVFNACFLADRDLSKAPWAILQIAAVIVAAVFGAALAGIVPGRGASDWVLAVVLVVVFTGTTLFTQRNGVKRAGVATATVAISVAVLGGMLMPSLVFAPLLPAGIIAVNLFNRRNSFVDHVDGARRIAVALRVNARLLVQWVAGWLFGPTTAATLLGRFAVRRGDETH